MTPQELSQLAKTNYAAYLTTDHWRTMRRLKVEDAEGRCQLCNKQSQLEASSQAARLELDSC
jgi:hypothetical protein